MRSSSGVVVASNDALTQPNDCLSRTTDGGMIGLARREFFDTLTAEMQQSPSSDEILRTIQVAMKELFDLDATRVQPSARLIEDLALDSVDALDLVARMEEATGQEFDKITLRKLRTIQDVIAAIQVVVEGTARRGRVPA